MSECASEIHEPDLTAPIDLHPIKAVSDVLESEPVSIDVDVPIIFGRGRVHEMERRRGTGDDGVSRERVDRAECLSYVATSYNKRTRRKIDGEITSGGA